MWNTFSIFHIARLTMNKLIHHSELIEKINKENMTFKGKATNSKFEMIVTMKIR